MQSHDAEFRESGAGWATKPAAPEAPSNAHGTSKYAAPTACGTCIRRVAANQPTEHEECSARAQLTPAPDMPDWEDLADLTDEQRQALPARFHIPAFEGNATPNAWLCAVCWGDGWVTRWPCKPALDNGRHVFAASTTA